MNGLKYASLHNHSEYSVGDGIAKPHELIKVAQRKGISAIAITDHGNMNGIADFFKEAEKNDFGVKHIFGNEGYYVKDLDAWAEDYALLEEKIKDKVLEKDEIKIERKKLYRYNHEVFVAKNQIGLENLFELTFLSHKLGFYRKPRMDRKMIERLKEGIFTTTACMAGPLSTPLWSHYNDTQTIDKRLIQEEIEWWYSVFGDNYALELQFNEIPWQNIYNHVLVELHKEMNIPLVVTTDSHYIEQKHFKLQQILGLINGNKLLNMSDEEVQKNMNELLSENDEFSCENLYVKNAEEIIESAKRFSPDIDINIVYEAIDHTYQISQDIEIIKLDREIKIPPIRDEHTNELLTENECLNRLTDLSLQLLKDNGLSNNKEYVSRLKKEIDAIGENHLATYFYIIYDLYKYGKQHQLAGPGRGSAAGSLLLYLLDITTLDPIEHNLLFERFISPGRIEMPDIDCDWEHPNDIKEYMKRKYGEDNVAYVSSYGTFSYRNLIKDLGRIFGHSFEEMNKVSSDIAKEVRGIYKLPEYNDQDKSTIVIDYDMLKKHSQTFNNFIGDKPEVDEAFQILFGKVRHVGRHAAGCVAAEKLYRQMPLQSGAGDGNRLIQTSYTEGVASKTLGEFGFLKFDILGLGTLRVFSHAYRLIAEKEGVSYEEIVKRFHPSNIDLNDQQVFKHVFHDGNFCGIFQFTESGIRKLAQDIKPDNFVDVATIGALYRPGPMGSGMHIEYGERKKQFVNGELTYQHPIEEKILGETYGIIAFQDQFMLLVKELGDFTWPEINAFRKSVVKRSKNVDMEKIHKEWDMFKNKFITNAMEKDCTEVHANELWEKMMYHAGYSFNKAHCFSYGMITYVSAYLATHYPVEFYASTLTFGGKDDFEKAIGEIRQLDSIEIVPVDINKSENVFVGDNNKIIIPFNKIKGIGEKSTDIFIEERNKKQFESFDGFLERSKEAKFRKKDVEVLIKIGAFDSLEGEDSRKMLVRKWNMFHNGKFYEDGKKRAKRYISNPEKFTEDFNKLEKEVYTHKELVEIETEFFGFGVFSDLWKIPSVKDAIRTLKNKCTYNDFNNFEFDGMKYFDSFKKFTNSKLNSGCLVLNIKDISVRKDKKGNEMAFITVVDRLSEEVHCPVFSRQYQSIKDNLTQGSLSFMRMFKNEKEECMLGLPGWNVSNKMMKTYIIPIDVFTKCISIF